MSNENKEDQRWLNFSEGRKMRQFRPVFLKSKNINEYSKNTNKEYSRMSPRVWIFLNKIWSSGILTIKESSWGFSILVARYSSILIVCLFFSEGKNQKRQGWEPWPNLCNDFIFILASRKSSLLLTKAKLSLLIADIDSDRLCSTCLFYFLTPKWGTKASSSFTWRLDIYKFLWRKSMS